MKTKNIYKTLTNVLFFMVLLMSGSVKAGLIFESAEYPSSGVTPNLGGIAIDDAYFVMHRFYLAESYAIESIGGYFWADNGRSLFGAVVGLSDDSDFPNAFDLSSSDVLATTLITIGNTDGDYSGKLNLGLASGWYAVAFGSGMFGADNIDPNGIGLGMPDLAIDLDNDLPITAINSKNPFGLSPQFVYQASTARFFVNGTSATSVPEPHILFVLLLSFVLMRFSRVTKFTF